MNDSTSQISDRLLEGLIHLERQRVLEHAKNRRARLIRTLIWAVALLGGPVMYLALYLDLLGNPALPDRYAGLVRVEGIIAPGANDARRVNAALDKAFADPRTTGVILLIISPGGTPTQAKLIYDHARHLRQQHGKPLIAVGEDSLTSGAYYLACAADTIVVAPTTITGSIGVVTRGFGFDGLLQRLDVQRRVLTAGEHKNFMDPFLPLSTDDRERIQGFLQNIHRSFIADVRVGRGTRLTGSEQSLFSGWAWTGDKAVEIGLADEPGDLYSAARTHLGTDAWRDFTPAPSLIQSLVRSLAILFQEAAYLLW